MAASKTLQIIILGACDVGKSSLLIQYADQRFSSQHSACDSSSTMEVTIDGTLVKLRLLVRAGQERFQYLGDSLYRGADACILVYDITNETSFEELDRWKEEFLTKGGPRDPDNFTFVVIGNKVDRESERRVPKSEVAQWCEYQGAKPIPYFETSAKEATMVQEAFLEAIRGALQQGRGCESPMSKSMDEEEFIASLAGMIPEHLVRSALAQDRANITALSLESTKST